MFESLQKLLRLGRTRPTKSPRADLRRRRWMVETLERREVMAGLPYGAMADDTGEYMLGKILVSVVFMESDPTLAPADISTEDWTSSSIAAMKSKIEEGLHWWQDTLATIAPKHANDLDFVLDYKHADAPVRTGYEPIGRKSDLFQSWIYDFLNKVGYNQSGDFSTDIRAFNNAQRLTNGTDWAFTIFVVNSDNDPDDAFAPGGTYNRAFAYSGGRFLIVPSGRPASTIAHETGHMFWARDEYTGTNYADRRGYYDTQNLNAPNNPTPGFMQLPSIMATGSLLDTAYANHTSAPSTLAMIGWQDSDGDGVFDVLDVPLTLKGTGYLDAQTGKYRFVGTSSVQTLPNQNSSGLQNDITLNKVSRAEWRINGGVWTTAATYGTSTANLNLTLTVPTGSHSIEIRTIDDATGITSAIFSGSTTQPASIAPQGISGFIFNDEDRDGQRDANENGLAGWTVQLVSAGGTPVDLTKKAEPDSYAAGTIITSLISGMTVSAIGPEVDSAVSVGSSSLASTGSFVFQNRDAFVSPAPWSSTWSKNKNLKISFAEPASTVSIDAIANSDGDYGRLEIYDSSNNLLGRVTSRSLLQGKSERLTLSRDSADIAYVVATGHLDSELLFDNFVVGPTSSTVTDEFGAYSLPYLPAGTYQVRAKAPISWTPSGTPAADQTVTLTNGQSQAQVNFGESGSHAPWQNPNNPLDVDKDNLVAPVDVLLIINELNTYGARTLAAPTGTITAYFDVSGDGSIAPDDALIVINFLNSRVSGEGSGESTGARSGSAGSGAANGESAFSEGETRPSLDTNLVVLKGSEANPSRVPASVSAVRAQVMAMAAPNDLRSRLSSRRTMTPQSIAALPSFEASLQLLAADVAGALHTHEEEEEDHHHHHHDD